MLLFLAVRNNSLTYSPFPWCSQTVQFFEKVRPTIHMSTKGTSHWGREGGRSEWLDSLCSVLMCFLWPCAQLLVYTVTELACAVSLLLISVFFASPQEAKEIGDVSTQTNQWTYSLSLLNEICILIYTCYYFILYHQKISWTVTWICSC